MAKKDIQTKKIQKLRLSNDPDVHSRAILPEDSPEIIKDKQRKMFEVGVAATLTIYFDDNTSLNLFAEQGYTYDGASIPFKIGKGNMKLLIPALFHDIICENKKLVNFNRELSSQIFYKTLLICHVNKIIAWCMYLIVDNYQKFMNWKEK